MALALPSVLRPMTASLITCLQQVGPIAEADRTLITAAWQPRQCAPGEVLFAAGSICQELFFIQQGVLRIMVQQPSGTDATHFFLKESQFASILYSFDNQEVATESIQAACPAEVLAIRKPRLEALYQQLPYLRGYLGQITQRALQEKIRLRHGYHLAQDATARYQLFLQQQPDVARQVALADVASYLGITAQSLSRIRKNRA
jgi:CRP-like cAMP-binding protein